MLFRSVMDTEAIIEESILDLFCNLVYGPALGGWTWGRRESAENSIEVW